MDKPGMRLFVLRTDDGTMPSVDEPSESILFRLEGVELSFDKQDARKHMGTGTLFVTQLRVIFLGSKQSFDFDVRFIALHAVSRDAESFPKPCLYCQFARDEDEMGFDEEGGEIGGSEHMSGTEEQPLSEEGTAGELELIASRALEMFLAPANDGDLLPLFNAFSNAALLNPDPVEPGHEDGEDDDDLFYNLDEVELGAAQAGVLEHLESVFKPPPEEE
jgi:hypothetical protein